MSKHHSLDRECFQQLLANAFAVQRSGLDRKSLSALIDLQQFIKTNNFDLERAMHIVVERALKVSTASGVAIALLEADGLVYRAGSGTATNDVGRHVPAVLSAASTGEVRREIVRVENAQTDSRVQGEICRQFDANALLMLPIYKDHVLFGLLQVLFTEAHSFVDSEVRMYNLMLGFIEDCIVSHPQHTWTTAVDSSFLSITGRYYDRQRIQRIELSTNSSAAFARAAGANPSLERRPRNHNVGHIRPLRALWTRISKAIINTQSDRPWMLTLWRIGIGITAAILVVTYNWTPYRDHPARSPLYRSLSKADNTRQHTTRRPSASDEEPMRAADRGRQTTRPRARFKRVRVGPGEVDYIAEDVTIRRFAIASAPFSRTRNKHVDFGDDVTVRYFTDGGTAGGRSHTYADDSH